VNLPLGKGISQSPMFGVSIYVMIEAVDGMFMFYVGRLNPLFTIINQNSEAHRFPQ